MPRRRWATLLLDDGIAEKIPRPLALQLVRMGDLKVVGKRPLTVSIPKQKNFAEEQRYCSGRRIPGITRGLFNDKASMSSGLRCKPPRSVINQGYVTTIGWVREAQKKMAEKEEKDREEKERNRKKSKAKRRRQMQRALILFLFMAPMLGQETHPLGDPLWWDANTEVDLVDYGVYRSDTPCVDVTPAPATCTAFSQIEAVSQGPDPRSFIQAGPVVFLQDYFYRVTARNSSGLESGFSNELNIRWTNPNAPAAPGNFRGTEQGASMRLDWDDVAHVNAYNIYKSSTDEEMGGVIAHTSENEYRDLNRGRIGPKYYRVTAMGDNGLESEYAGPVLYMGRTGQDSRGNPRR